MLKIHKTALILMTIGALIGVAMGVARGAMHGKATNRDKPISIGYNIEYKILQIDHCEYIVVFKTWAETSPAIVHHAACKNHEGFNTLP